MAITVLKNCPGEGVMSHNHPPLYGSLILGGIYKYTIAHHRKYHQSPLILVNEELQWVP